MSEPSLHTGAATATSLRQTLLRLKESNKTLVAYLPMGAGSREMLDSKGPYVLNVLTPYQEHVLPMIPGGMTVKDIIKA